MSAPTARELTQTVLGGHSGNEMCSPILAARVEAVIQACKRGADTATILLILDGQGVRIDGPEGDVTLRSGPDHPASEVPRG